MKKILIVDDEINLRNVLKIIFRKDGYHVTTSADGKDAIELLKVDDHWDCIISDLKMKHTSGMELLKHVQIHCPDTPFILITAYGSIPDAVKAIKSGASDFISKPFNKNVLRHLVLTLIQEAEERKTSRNPREERIYNTSEAGILYASPQMHEILKTVRKAARTKLSICIQGESGVGKERIARAIHHYHTEHEQNSNLPFISINCPAIPENLIESELFGYRKGAFTGATKDFPGKVQSADSGTLFLDEIADLPLSIQPKFLRLLEDGSYEPLGGTQSFSTDARFICATNADLEKKVGTNSFREDLFYRISTIRITVPPLRERTEDIPVLSGFFLQEFCKNHLQEEKYLHQDSMDLLLQYPWPGNVRELKNIILSTAALSENIEILPSDLPEHIQKYGNSSQVPEQKMDLKEQEAELIRASIRQAGGNISGAARILGISRGSLRYKIEKLNIRYGQL